jgi:nucleoside-diphosphate-sugar epimerase
VKIFIAGASGAIGKRLVPLLVAAGHRVMGSTRTEGKCDAVRALGAEAVVLDGLDKPAINVAIESFQPDVVVHQMTSLASLKSLKHFDEDFEQTNRLRALGTEYLLAAARSVGAKKFIAQSYAGWPTDRTGPRVQTEEDPYETNPPESMRKSLRAIVTLESLVRNASGITAIALRFGSFYGPGTSLGADGEVTKLVRRRKFPVVGSGAGVWSFLHVEDAGHATKLAIDRAPAGIYNIVDDEPAEASQWLPYLADCIGAKPPRHIPVWLAKFAIGEAGVLFMTEMRGASNAKAKREFNWRPVYASWREGFRRGLADPTRSA